MVDPARSWLTVGAAAALLGVSVPTLRRWDKGGKLTARRHPMSGFRAYARADVERLAAQLAGSPDADPKTAPRGAAEDVIGRDRELAAVMAMLAPGAVVALLGPAGVGKTTLARLCAGRFGGSTSFGDLAAAASEPELLARVAADLGVELDTAATDAVDRLGRAIAAAGSGLLVLDDLDRVVSPAIRLLDAMARHGARMCVLTTSRRRLGAPGERTVQVAPLALPARGARTSQELLACEAVALLERRARQAGAGDLRDELPALAELARRLDGLPLALELAGAQLALLSPEEILRRLAKSGDLRRVRGRDRRRHDSLGAALDASWQLLDDDARSALAQLSVFRGGFTAADAEAVVRLETSAPPLLDLLATLRDRSLLRADPGARPARFELLTTVCEHARRQLARADVREVTARHARRYAEIAALALSPPPLTGSETTRRLVAERDNLLAAHATSLGHDRLAALTIAVALEHALRTRVSIGQLTSLLQASIRGAARHPPARAVLGRARAALGRLLCERGELVASARELAKAQVLARAARDAALEEQVLGLRALVHVLRGERSAALRTVARAQRLAARDDDPAHRFTFAHCASVLHEAGRLADAERSYLVSRAIAERLGDSIFAARILARLGRVWSDAGRWDRAEPALAESIAALEQSDDRYLAWALAHRAMHLRRRGLLDAAREAYERALPLFVERGATAPEVLHRALLASAQADLGRDLEALASLAAARAGAERLRDRQLGASVRIASGHADLLEARRASRRGDPAAGRRALRAARRALASARALGSADKDVRAGAELLERRLDEHEHGSNLPDRPPLVADAQGAWFTPPAGKRVLLPDGSPLSRLLAELFAARAARPGLPCTRQALLAAGWPNERVLPSAAAQRLYTAVADLRARGLERVLLSRDDGYLLDPATPSMFEGAPDHA